MVAAYNPSTTKTDIPAYVSQAFKKNHGWKPGLEWNRPCDPMHFQRK